MFCGVRVRITPDAVLRRFGKLCAVVASGPRFKSLATLRSQLPHVSTATAIRREQAIRGERGQLRAQLSSRPPGPDEPEVLGELGQRDPLSLHASPMAFCAVDRREHQLIQHGLEPPQLTPGASSLWHWTAPSLGARGADRDQPPATASRAKHARLRDNRRCIEASSSVPGPGALPAPPGPLMCKSPANIARPAAEIERDPRQSAAIGCHRHVSEALASIRQ
jgi:hypothetical protein